MVKLKNCNALWPIKLNYIVRKIKILDITPIDSQNEVDTLLTNQD